MSVRRIVTYKVNTALPRVRRTIAAGFKAGDLASKRKAATLLVLFRTGCRPGNTRYTRANASHGLTTLKLSHLKLNNARCVLVRYTGKKQVKQRHEVCSPDLVKWVRYCITHKERVFLHRHELVQALALFGIRPKDVRTWKANELYKCHTTKQGLSHTEAVRQTARILGNTPSVTARSYVASELQEAQRKKEGKKRTKSNR